MHTEIKVLIVCTVDLTVKVLLAAQIRALERAGYTVHVACGNGPHVAELVEAGFKMKTIDMVNRASPLVNLKSLINLYRLMRRERYDIVHVHVISAAFIGRIAAWLARVPLVIYTFRGFAFYKNSPWWVKPFNLLLELPLRLVTDFTFSQSEENRKRAIRYKVIDPIRSLTIGNGVATNEFARQTGDPELANRLRKELGIAPTARVVGMTGRLIREKGVIEFFEAAAKVSVSFPDAVFLIVGEALPSDGKQGIGREFRRMVEHNGLGSKFVFTGFRSDATRLYAAMDIFVLPSYHEGMPRSIIEAMASGKPVIATDIPGCQDEVLHEETGLLVPVADSEALAQLITKLLDDPEMARQMGKRGQERAIELFDERLVCQRIVAGYQKIVDKKFGDNQKAFSLHLKQAIDYVGAAVALVLLSPVMAVTAMLIRLESHGPVLFRQIRAGRFDKPFTIYKFRTMVVGAEKTRLEVSTSDPRITRLGRFLRNTSLDELPQLINVLRGEMSLIGPRPLLPGTVRADEKPRQRMKPGVTSLPVLYGRAALRWDERMPIDLWYVDHWSLWLDLKIALKTIPIVLSQKNVYDPRGGSSLRPEHSSSAPSEGRNASGLSHEDPG